MKRLKILTSLFITSSIVLSSTIAYAGEWIKSGNDWRYLQDNSSYAVGWIQDSNGKWYYMSTNGIMQTGWIQDGANWYYLNADGSMAVNTVIDGYTLGASGAWVTNPFQAKLESNNGGTPGTNGASAQSMSEQNGYQDNTQSSSSSSTGNKFQDRQVKKITPGTNGASAQSMSEANK